VVHWHRRIGGKQPLEFEEFLLGAAKFILFAIFIIGNFIDK